MDKNIKKLWVEALRSGKYKQGKNYLHRVIDGENRFCCLGVLCKIADLAAKEISANKYSYSYAGVESTSRLPTGFDAKVKLTFEEQTLLTGMNDGVIQINGTYSTDSVHRKSFLEIADWIEENL